MREDREVNRSRKTAEIRNDEDAFEKGHEGGANQVGQRLFALASLPPIHGDVKGCQAGLH